MTEINHFNGMLKRYRVEDRCQGYSVAYYICFEEIPKCIANSFEGIAYQDI